MAIEDLRREHTAEGSSDRVFGLVFAAFFTIIALWPLLSGGVVRAWAVVVAAGFGGLALALPHSLSRLNRMWMHLGLLLGRIVSPIALGFVYWLTVVPTGFFWRLTGKDSLGLKYDAAAKTYWISRDPPGPDPKSLNNQF